jgi:nucleoside-diphosphate kinase
MEYSLIIFKPDCVQRKLVGTILSRFEKKGLSILAMKMMRFSSELARRHYREHVEKAFFPSLEAFVTSSPVVVMIVAGPSAISVIRQMVGPTNGREAPSGTIRGDYGLSPQKNLIHASDSLESAKREIDLFFNKEEIFAYECCDADWLE